MAPEVFLHEPYNTSVDVYSFAMICFQLFEGCVPYEGIDAVQAAKSAAIHKERPKFTDLAGNTPHRSVRQVPPPCVSDPLSAVVVWEGCEGCVSSERWTHPQELPFRLLLQLHGFCMHAALLWPARLGALRLAKNVRWG